MSSCFSVESNRSGAVELIGLTLGDLDGDLPAVLCCCSLLGGEVSRRRSPIKLPCWPECADASTRRPGDVSGVAESTLRSGVECDASTEDRSGLVVPELPWNWR